jgi:hypothetical protein
MDAYEMRLQLRDNLGEAVASHWTEAQLVRRLNIEHKAVARKVIDSPGDWLLKKSDALTPSSNRLTLPTDCLRPVYVEEVTSGRMIPIRGTVREKAGGRFPGYGGTVEAYLIGNYIEINLNDYGNTCYLWYQPRVLDLQSGTCQASTGATSVYFELANFPSGVDDYYNGVTLHIYDVSTNALNFNGLIADWVGLTGIATIASAAAAPAATDLYGTVSPLPEEVHNLIVMRATVKAIAKPSSTFEKELFSFYRAELKKEEEDVESFLTSRLGDSVYTRITDY